MGGQYAKVLLIGLDNSGKTSIMERILNPSLTKLGTTPTIGYKKTQFSRYGLDVQVLDMSGEAKYRDLWLPYTANIAGVIFVVDSSDKMRINVARSELEIITEEKSVAKGIPYLIFANKADLPAACPLDEAVAMLSLKEKNLFFQAFSCSAQTGKGVEEGLQWFCKAILTLKGG